MATTTAAVPVSGTQKIPGGEASTFKTVRKTAVMVLSYLVLISFALATIFPFVFAITNSFKTTEDFTANPTSLFPSSEFGWSTKGYEKVLSTPNPDFGRALFNSILISIVVTLGRIILCSMAGYALARIKFPGRGLVFAALIGTLMIPAIVLLIPRFLVYKTLGMVDSYSSLILPVLSDAFGIFLMKQFFESIPKEIEEAADLDGASRFRMFFVVILPMATPAIIALAIFSFQGSWNDFTGPLIATSGTKPQFFTLPLALALYIGQTGLSKPWDLLLSSAVMTTLPMAIVFFIFQRFFVEGVSYTGVKG